MRGIDRLSRPGFGAVFFAAALAWSVPALAEDPEISVAPPPEAPAAAPDRISEEVKAFCANIADAARDQRYLRQSQELKDLQAGVDERIRLLEKRRAEYEIWLKKREEFLKVAEDTLVEIYRKMRPDAAASQLELVHPEIAAAIVMKLNPRLASQILNEMAADKAASLTGIIADAASRQMPKEPS